MCGIVGFTGAAQAAPILLDGLAKLEYRGYDSAGMAVQNAAGKIVASLSEPFQVAGRSLTISCSVGIARFPDDGDTADSLIQYADHAMYRAKKQGRARWSL